MTTKCYDTIPDTNGEQISIVVPCPRATEPSSSTTTTPVSTPVQAEVADERRGHAARVAAPARRLPRRLGVLPPVDPHARPARPRLAEASQERRRLRRAFGAAARRAAVHHVAAVGRTGAALLPMGRGPDQEHQGWVMLVRGRRHSPSPLHHRGAP